MVEDCSGGNFESGITRFYLHAVFKALNANYVQIVLLSQT